MDLNFTQLAGDEDRGWALYLGFQGAKKNSHPTLSIFWAFPILSCGAISCHYSCKILDIQPGAWDTHDFVIVRCCGLTFPLSLQGARESFPVFAHFWLVVWNGLNMFEPFVYFQSFYFLGCIFQLASNHQPVFVWFCLSGMMIAMNHLIACIWYGLASMTRGGRDVPTVIILFSDWIHMLKDRSPMKPTDSPLEFHSSWNTPPSWTLFRFLSVCLCLSCYL